MVLLLRQMSADEPIDATLRWNAADYVHGRPPPPPPLLLDMRAYFVHALACQPAITWALKFTPQTGAVALR